MNKHFHCDGKSRVYENFLTEEECNKLYNFMHNFNYDGLKEYNIKYFNKRQISKQQMSIQPGYENIMDEIEPELNQINLRLIELLNKDDHDAQWYTSQYILMKIYPDQFVDKKEGMFLHVDNHGWMEGKVFWGVVLYLNDDYDGGELYYPEYEHYYKPKRKDLIMHSGDIVHGVKEVTSGQRYAITVLVRISGEYNNNPLPVSNSKGEPTPDGKPYFYPPGYWGKRMPDDPIQGDIKVPRSDGTFAEYNANPTVYIPKA